MKVSIAMVTYRHERFLAQAIESVLNQRTNFDFELVIGDDASPDRTGAIAREYAARYPDKIRLEEQPVNVGLTRNLSRTIGACRGEYIAWLEGDDYWTSPEKLQRQADYLDANRDCAWCFTRAIVVDESGNEIDAPPAVRTVKPKYTLEDYLSRIFQPRACTVMFRHRLFDKFPDWFYGMPTGDMPLHVLNCAKGDIGFVDEVMAAYRIHPGGVWSQGVKPGDWKTHTPEQQKRQAERLVAMIGLFEAVDRHLAGQCRPILRKQIAEFARTLSGLRRALGDRPGQRRALWKAFLTEPQRNPVRQIQNLARTFLPEQQSSGKKSQNGSLRLEPNVAAMPIPQDRLQSLRPNDQFLVSYPRSGNTWTRHLLRDVIALEKPDVPYPENLWQVIPDLHIPAHQMEHEAVQQFGMPTRILKSHNLTDLGNRRFVYIARQPADSLVSYYHFHRLHDRMKELVTTGIDAFCCAMVDGWVEHVELALKRHQENPTDVLLVTYEGLHADGVSELRRIAQFLGLTASDATLAAALERSAFAKLRSREESQRDGSDEYFFRKGKSGTAKTELSPETLEMISAKAQATYQRVITAIEASRAGA